MKCLSKAAQTKIKRATMALQRKARPGNTSRKKGQKNKQKHKVHSNPCKLLAKLHAEFFHMNMN